VVFPFCSTQNMSRARLQFGISARFCTERVRVSRVVAARDRRDHLDRPADPPEDAVAAYREMGLDALALGDELARRTR
jgi:hypothetical protein